MGRIKRKTGIITAVLVSTIIIIILSACENPVQGYIATNLYGPKYNLEVKKFTETGAIDYGFSVDTYGDYTIVGAPAGGGNTEADESAYIYHRTGVDTWEGPFKLHPPADDWQKGDRFGYSVSIYGDFAAVSAPYKSVNGLPNAGAVYIYKRISGTDNEWEEIKKFTKADQNGSYTFPVTGNEQFGYAVKLYGDWLLVGVPYDGLNGPGSDYGVVYRFKYNGTDWQYDYFFSPNTQLAGANFGMAIDVNSSYAVIGAPGEDIDGNDKAGSVYIFSFNSGKFELKERITDIDNYTGDDDYFGGSVSISGDFLAVGVGGAIVKGIFIAGRVQVYKLKDGKWNNTPTLLQLDEPAAYDFFGYPVALKQIDEGKYILLAGCVDRDNGESPDVGAVYIYTNTEGTNKWVLQKELRASDSSVNYFGKSIALGDDYAVIGACHLWDVYKDGGVLIFR